MSYRIKRECWNEKTYNGYTDNPYWRIGFSFYEIGLKDNGEYWSINNSTDLNVSRHFVEEELKKIINECKLNIVLQ